MSDVNKEIEAWRHQFEQVDGVTATDVMELESHLMQEMDALQKSGLRPDESFVIASRRLGHPYELAVEFSKNDSLAMWKRPARLLLWGMLSLEIVSVSWIAVLVALCFVLRDVGWSSQIPEYLLDKSMFVGNAAYAATLVMLWALVGRPQGIVARTHAKLERAIQTRAGAVSLVLGAASLVAVNVFYRVCLQSYLNHWHSESAHPVQYGAGLILQITLPRMIWFMAIATILVLLTRAESAKRVTRLASE